MTDFVAFPLLVTLGVALLGGPLLDRVRPAPAARCSAIMLGSLLVAAVPTLWLMGLSGLAHVGFHSAVLDWSHHLLPEHRVVGAIIGVTSLLAAVIGTARAARVLRLHRRLRCADTCPIELVDSDEVFAYTLPGPAATIAVSRGLRQSLDDDEFDLVVAHERAHARHRHDRLLLLSLVTVAFLPVVRPVGTRLGYYLERWADEDAVVETGVERPAAARTIAKVALATATTPRFVLGVASHGVAARAEALLQPARPSTIGIRAHPFLLIATTVALAGSQLHHTALFALELAP